VRVRRVRVRASASRTGRASRRTGAFTARMRVVETGELGELGGVDGLLVLVLALGLALDVERALYTMLQAPRPNSIGRLSPLWMISRSLVKYSGVLTLGLGAERD
jgi:hypothetical protein